MKCNGCGGCIPFLAEVKVIIDVLSQGGDISTIEIGWCENCPVEILAEWEQRKLEETGNKKYGRLNS